MEKIQTIRRKFEVCSKCGAVDKFVARQVTYSRGTKRTYLVCKVCGTHAIRVEY